MPCCFTLHICCFAGISSLWWLLEKQTKCPKWAISLYVGIGKMISEVLGVIIVLCIANCKYLVLEYSLYNSEYVQLIGCIMTERMLVLYGHLPPECFFNQSSYQRWLDKIIYKTEMKFWAILGSRGCREKNTSQLP